MLQVKQILLLFYGLCSKRFEDMSQKIWTEPPNGTPLSLLFGKSMPHPNPKMFGSLLSVLIKWPWVLWILSETYFNQNQLKLRYMLPQTYICNIAAPSDHGHLCWASRKTSFQCLHLHRAAINTRYEKNVRDFFTSWNFDLLLWFAEKSW